jgi:tRNA isopentenyl-2-thiomethyl-A-37 hydroxylase MiaE
MTTRIDQNMNAICDRLPLHWKTPDTWLTAVSENINAFLADHAACERKASAAALMLANKYPEYTELQERMIALAIEELQHFHQIARSDTTECPVRAIQRQHQLTQMPATTKRAIPFE